MNETLDQVHVALTSVSQFAHLKQEDYKATRLGGLTNLVFKIETPVDCLIVRIPGKGTEEYIDRVVEAHNAKVAAEAGVSAEVIFVDPSTGLMITRCIDDIVTMSPELFRSREGSVARAALALKKLHTSGKQFKFRFELFGMIDEYLNHLSGKNTDLPDGYHDIVHAAQPVKVALENNPNSLAPCHCDPLCENFLDDGGTMWVVDWEYSGMNDPIWDLGDLSVEASFNADQDREMMRAYCDGEPTEAEFARMIIYKAMCDLLWTLWGLIQHADDNPAEDFWAYSVGRFERCKKLMTDPAFEGYVEAVCHG